MNISQLKNSAAFYGCHVKGTGRNLRIHAPNYSISELIPDLDSKTDRDIQAILEKLSGKKMADLWNSGKGSGAK